MRSDAQSFQGVKVNYPERVALRRVDVGAGLQGHVGSRQLGVLGGLEDGAGLEMLGRGVVPVEIVYHVVIEAAAGAAKGGDISVALQRLGNLHQQLSWQVSQIHGRSCAGMALTGRFRALRRESVWISAVSMRDRQRSI